jgi:glucose/arabinose dehydrogenase
MPRILRPAPNGYLFVADSQAGSILVLRGVTAAGRAAAISTYATGLDHPFGIAFYPSGAQPQWMYVGNATTVIRFPYMPGDLKATGAPQTIVPEIPGNTSS